MRKEEILATLRLGAYSKIFVRITENFLCYGVLRRGRWTVGGYNLDSKTWLKQKLELPEGIGSEVGLTIAFEIFDNFLYGVSNQTLLEAEEEY